MNLPLQLVYSSYIATVLTEIMRATNSINLGQRSTIAMQQFISSILYSLKFPDHWLVN